MKVSELQGAALALWVAKALGYELATDLAQIGEAAAGMRSPVFFYSESGTLGVAGEGLGGPWRPHEDWTQGGPIIERELIELSHDRDWREDGEFGRVWDGNHAGYGYVGGDTPLIAAMRAFVASKYGDTVPDE